MVGKGSLDRIAGEAPSLKPLLYERKTKWPKVDESVQLHDDWKVNDSSLRGHEEQVLRQFQEETDEDLMITVTLEEALDMYGSDLLIAAKGAIAKKGQEPGGTFHFIFDGTNGVYLNVGVTIRDQIRYPTAPDHKAVLAELAEEGGSYYCLLYDIKKAHRRIPVRKSDWGKQACRDKGSAAASAQLRSIAKKEEATAKEGEERPIPPLTKSDFTKDELQEDVFSNCVGTVGVTSAG